MITLGNVPVALSEANRELSVRLDKAKVKLCLFDLFINATPNQNSRVALANDIRDLERFLLQEYDITPPQANLSHLGAYRESLVSVKSVATIKRRVASIRKFYKFLFIQGDIDDNINVSLDLYI